MAVHGGAGSPGGNVRGDGELETQGPEANARLTGTLAAVLLVLLAAEGFTVLSVRRLLAPHVFIGMVLIPPVLLKIGSTMYRFVRYYLGSDAYRRKGPPPVVLRFLGPFVVTLTVAVLGTGVALMFVPRGSRSEWLFLHKASFVLVVRGHDDPRRGAPGGYRSPGPPGLVPGVPAERCRVRGSVSGRWRAAWSWGYYSGCWWWAGRDAGCDLRSSVEISAVS